MTRSACGVPFGPLDAGVDVFRVLAENDDVHPLGVGDRRGRAVEVANRPDTGVQVEHLTQRDVQAPDAAADRRRQRPLDGDFVRLDRFQRVVREPFAGDVLRLFAGENLEPGEAALPP